VDRLTASAQLIEDKRQGAVFRPIEDAQIGIFWPAPIGAHDVAVATDDDHSIAGVHADRRVRLVGEINPAPSVHEDVKRDDMLELGHDLGADAGGRRRLRDPGRPRSDVEKNGTGHSDGAQHIGQHIQGEPPDKPRAWSLPTGARGANLDARARLGDAR
jgi:hypothetical protein